MPPQTYTLHRQALNFFDNILICQIMHLTSAACLRAHRGKFRYPFAHAVGEHDAAAKS